MSSESGWRTFLGPIALLVFSYFIYFVRYPLGRTFAFVEPLFIMLFLSYFAVLVLSLFLLKKEFKKSFSEVFKVRGFPMIVMGVVFALLFQVLWLLFSLGFGSRLEFTPITSLRGYERYAVHSLFTGFVLYFAFAIFGTFAEEVAYRSYVQPRIQVRYGYIVGIFCASLFFSLQHIQFFQLSWIERFFQTQFVYVFLFGIFAGYLFFKNKGDIWSVFAFHATMNICNISLPLQVTPIFSYVNQLATIPSFLLLFLLLRFGLKDKSVKEMQQNPVL